MSEEIDLVLSGSGTLLPCHVGAYAALVDGGFRVRRVAGTSGGSIVAAGIAHGLDGDQMLGLAKDVLGGGLLETNWFLWRGFGLHKMTRIRSLLAANFPGRMADAKIPFCAFAVDVETQSATLLSRETFPSAPVADVCAASAAIPVFFQAQRIKTAPGLYVDGGVRANFAMAVFDDVADRRTVGVRFRHTHRRRKVSDVRSYVGALMGTMIDSANHTYVSSKRYADVIEIDSKGDGMDFELSSDDVQALYDEGYDAAAMWSATKGGDARIP